MRQRFSQVASRYGAGSRWHAGEGPLAEVVTFCRPAPDDAVLDVATGAGNTALALAPRVRSVLGLDITREMLDEARRQAAAKGIDNARWVLGDAARLPFLDASFDLYVVRAAPHHFPDLGAALAEAARVARPGARAVFIDCSPPLPARDVLHAVEVGRDPSHVRSLTLEERVASVESAGLRVVEAERRPRDWDYEDWMERMAVPAPARAELARSIEGVQAEARAQLRPRRRGGRLWFTYWHAFVRAVRP